MMKRTVLTATVTALLAWHVPALAQREAPYWASISAGQARMRTGPGRNFPATWLYQRAGMPVYVIETYPAWRKVRDPDGAEGWMQANLLSERRTAMVRGDTRALRDGADGSGRVLWRAEEGVIGAISQCEDGWCLFDAGGRRGYIEEAGLWGVTPGEEVD